MVFQIISSGVWCDYRWNISTDESTLSTAGVVKKKKLIVAMILEHVCPRETFKGPINKSMLTLKVPYM